MHPLCAHESSPAQQKNKGHKEKWKKEEKSGQEKTSASWLSQVEIWFGIFTRKSLRGASFTCKEELIKSIHAFIENYNQNAAPFVWRKREVKGAQLKNTIVNLWN